MDFHVPTHRIGFVTTSNRATLPTQGHPGDAGFDLYAAATVVVPPHEHRDIPHDLAIELPEGLYARITGRSSTMRKHGLIVTEGIIDQGFRGELFSGVYNLRDAPFLVEVGMRLSQLIPSLLAPVLWERVESLQASSRGIQGFGSTGV